MQVMQRMKKRNTVTKENHKKNQERITLLREVLVLDPRRVPRNYSMSVVGR